MYNKEQENRFVNNYRALNNCTKVEAMVEYRSLMRTNTPYTRSLKNETIDGFEERRNRGY